MLCVGLLYLFFEMSIVTKSSSGSQVSHAVNGVSRSILGVQVGLIVLAMIVTRSSVTSLQAKRGLPVGNQVLGWIVLGRPRSLDVSILLINS